MTKTDFTKAFQDALSAFPVDTKAFQEAFKTQAAFGERLSKVVLEAAEKSAEISGKWTKAHLAKLGDVSTAKTEAADYSKALSDYASGSAELAAEHVAAFAEIAKRVQLDTVELLLAAGKDIQAEATAAVQKATSDVTAAAKKATEEVTAAAKKATAAK